MTAVEKEIAPLEAQKTYWLKKGVNSFGTHARNDIRLPKEAGAQYAGIFFLKNDTVILRANPLALIKGNGRALDNTVVFSTSKNLPLVVGMLYLRFINAEGKIGIEVRIKK